MADRLRVAIADDHPLFREGVVHTLRSSKFLEVVGEAGSAQDAVRIAREALPDIMLLDLSMPGGGIEAARSIARVCPNVKMIMLTVSKREQDIAQALEAGAMGYVLKDTSGPELHRTILAVWRGKSYITPRLDVRLLSLATRRKPTEATDLPELIEREVQVLAQVARGLTNQEVARTLQLSEKTVKHHMTNIMQKLQVRNRVEAVLAFQNARSMKNKNVAAMSEPACINGGQSDTRRSRQTGRRIRR